MSNNIQNKKLQPKQNNTIDEKFFTNLKTHGIDIGINYKQYCMNKNYLSIITDVVFSSINDNIISGNTLVFDNTIITLPMKEIRSFTFQNQEKSITKFK
jgi:hypothetical protein